eukprot:1990530-Amphidinium_carterae.1
MKVQTSQSNAKSASNVFEVAVLPTKQQSHASQGTPRVVARSLSCSSQTARALESTIPSLLLRCYK